MPTTDFLFGAICLFIQALGISASCLRSIPCPCGTKEDLVYYKQCINTTFDEKFACERWINCDTCEANTSNCLTCPPGRSGPTCDEAADSIFCRYPEPKPNSRLITPISRDEILLPGTELLYMCNAGYNTYDPLIIFCMNIGDWTAHPPTCRPTIIEADPIFCRYPEQKPNSRLVTSVREDQILLPGTQLTYACDEGFKTADPLIIFCMDFGDWTSSPPACNRVEPTINILPSVIPILCPNPTFHSDVYMEYISPNDPRTRELRFVVGSQVRFTCRSGFELNGPNSIICLENGQWTNDPPKCTRISTLDCGCSGLWAESKITNGRNIQPGEFPWIVLITNGTSTITGILLDRRTVITVAHYFDNIQYYTLYFGKYNKNDSNDEKSVETRMISQIIIHPEYNEETFDNDIAIVKFSPDISYSERIQPICLPTTDSFARNIVPAQKGYLLGWSLNKNDLPSPNLIVTPLRIQAAKTCVSAFQRLNQPLKIAPGMLCGGYLDKSVHVCNGGSGAPFVSYSYETDRFTLEGIESHRTPGSCYEPETYIIFLKVSYYMQWILQNLQN